MVRCPFYGGEVVIPGFQETTPEGVLPPNGVLTTFDDPTGAAPDLGQPCDAGEFTRTEVMANPQRPHISPQRRCDRCAAIVSHSSAPLPSGGRRP